jgi:hypothetical protein
VLDLSPQVRENLDQFVMNVHEFVVATGRIAGCGAESIGKVAEPLPDSGI